MLLLVLPYTHWCLIGNGLVNEITRLESRDKRQRQRPVRRCWEERGRDVRFAGARSDANVPIPSFSIGMHRVQIALGGEPHGEEAWRVRGKGVQANGKPGLDISGGKIIMVTHTEPESLKRAMTVFAQNI